MLPRFVRLGVAAATLAVALTPAVAQNFSPGYQFLQAVRKADGAEVNKILAKDSAILNTKDRDSGESALHIVAARSDALYLRVLLGRGANANITDARGNTPLMVAVEKDFREGIDILIENHAQVNLANASGETPLIRAVQMRNYEVARMLLAAGADPDQADVIAGKSARDYARADNRSPAITKLLSEATKVQKRAVVGPKL